MFAAAVLVIQRTIESQTKSILLTRRNAMPDRYLSSFHIVLGNEFQVGLLSLPIERVFFPNTLPKYLQFPFSPLFQCDFLLRP